MKKKSLVALLLALTLVVGLFAGCGKKEESTTEAPTGTEEGAATEEEAPPEENPEAKTSLVLATEATFPPYEYMDGTEVVGVDVEVAQAIADELGLPLEVENMYFDSLIPSLKNGKADLVAAGMSVTPERQEEVDFSMEYATSVQVILTTPDSGISTIEDLNGKVVGVQMGTISDIVLQEDYPEVEVLQGKKYTDLAMDLANGKIDAIILDSLPAQAIQKTNETFIICEEEFFQDVYAIAVQKGNTELLETINTVLQKLIDDGTINALVEKHLG